MLIERASLAQDVASLRGGERHPVAHAEEVCRRIAQTDRLVQALVLEPDRCARLMSEAADLVARFPRPGERPPLSGIPVGVKDLFRVDGLPTRAGSTLPPSLFDGPESVIVTRLRQAGSLILGKTAMDEFAVCEPAPTRNPHNLEHTPGGSSSGSAAAVASGICPLAIGSQTTRSTIGPAAFCGVVGFKPSYDRVPCDGVLLSPSLDTIGFFTQDIPSLALASAALIDGWRSIETMRRPVLGIPDGIIQTYMFDEARSRYELQREQLRRAGYVIRTVPFFDDAHVEAVYRDAMTLLNGEMAALHQPWFATYEERYRPRTASAVCQGRLITAEQLACARAGQHSFRTAVEALMVEAGIDLWVLPASTGSAPRGLETTGWGGMTTPWSYAGLPCLTVPAGRAASGLPLGLQLIGRFNADETLVAWAHDIALVVEAMADGTLA